MLFGRTESIYEEPLCLTNLKRFICLHVETLTFLPFLIFKPFQSIFRLRWSVNIRYLCLATKYVTKYFTTLSLILNILKIMLYISNICIRFFFPFHNNLLIFLGLVRSQWNKMHTMTIVLYFTVIVTQSCPKAWRCANPPKPRETKMGPYK